MESRRIRAVVLGRVQGVGFRALVRRRAQESGVSGWVRNRPDGSVEFEAEGPPEILEKFLSDVRTGSGWARVDRLETTAIDASGEREDFEVRHDGGRTAEATS